jgi:hypothetical protein
VAYGLEGASVVNELLVRILIEEVEGVLVATGVEPLDESRLTARLGVIVVEC